VDRLAGNLHNDVMIGRAIKKGGAQLVSVTENIDDHLKHCESTAQVNVDAIFFGGYPWNEAAMIPKRLEHCVDWSKVKRYFSER
jgi:hypothetical protein